MLTPRVGSGMLGNRLLGWKSCLKMHTKGRQHLNTIPCHKNVWKHETCLAKKYDFLRGRVFNGLSYLMYQDTTPSVMGNEMRNASWLKTKILLWLINDCHYRFYVCIPFPVRLAPLAGGLRATFCWCASSEYRHGHILPPTTGDKSRVVPPIRAN